MIDAGPTLRCPQCRGPIAYWTVQPRFRCHHCHTVLQSNHRRVQLWLALAAISLWLSITLFASRWSDRPWFDLAWVVGGVWLPASLLLGWWGLRVGVRLKAEVGLPADRLFSAWPGPPRSTPSAPADALGFHAAGGSRAALAMASRRPARPDDPYDVDLSLRAVVWPTAEAAAHAFAHERAQDERLMQAWLLLPGPGELFADEVFGRVGVSPASSIVVQVRYGRHVMRAVGRLHPDGLFPDAAAFAAALRSADRCLQQHEAGAA